MITVHSFPKTSALLFGLFPLNLVRLLLAHYWSRYLAIIRVIQPKIIGPPQLKMFSLLHFSRKEQLQTLTPFLPFSQSFPPKPPGHKQRNVFSVNPFWQVPLFKQGAESQAFFREKDKWWWRHCKVLLYYSIPLKEKVDNYSTAVIIYHGGGGGVVVERFWSFHHKTRLIPHPILSSVKFLRSSPAS